MEENSYKIDSKIEEFKQIFENVTSKKNSSRKINSNSISSDNQLSNHLRCLSTHNTPPRQVNWLSVTNTINDDINIQ